MAPLTKSAGRSLKIRATNCAVSSSDTNRIDRIPNLVHFVFVAADMGDIQPTSFIQYLAIMSAFATQEPQALIVWSTFQPWGIWWKALAPYVHLQRIHDPPTMWGNKTIIHPAHVSDAIRLQVLSSVGGVYLDSDVISLRSFAPLRTGEQRSTRYTQDGLEAEVPTSLTQHDMVMAREIYRGEEKGLCNAVMFAARGADFLRVWNQSMPEHFVPTGWGEASVELPLLLSRQWPELITVLPESFFFKPSWYEAQSIFLDPDARVGAEYAHHLWGGASKVYLKKYTDGRDVWPRNEVPNNMFEKMIQHLARTTRLWNCSTAVALSMIDP